MNILVQCILCKDSLGWRCHKLRMKGLSEDISYKGYFLSAILLLQMACHRPGPTRACALPSIFQALCHQLRCDSITK